MGFENLNTDAGVAVLNTYIADKSYIVGYEASKADAAVYAAVGSAPSAAKYPHAARWFNHIASFKARFAQYDASISYLLTLH